MTFSPDLPAYFARLGLDGPRAPTLANLHALVHAHVRAIPFENLDVLLGRGIDLEPEAVEQKLVHARRGGYCFEQNTLLLHVLRALGYQAVPLSARVRVQRPRDYLPARTHLFVRVELDGTPWLADVGVGAVSPTAALRLDTEEEQATPHEPRRIVREGRWHGPALRGPEALLYHQVRYGGAWHDVCEFTLEEMPEIDRVVANWYTSAHPRSHFKDRLIVARATEEGRLTLVNRELSVRDRAGQATTTRIADPDELLEVLATRFGLRFPAGTRFPCPALDWA
ncbi:MAG TPA: arylamine N-acetyltransferase [Kofleriaceae bacterium]|nr:arylamine N-acetyltransferase [Kofleriaceae bacterium]